MREPNREHVIEVVAKAIAISDDEDWRRSREDDRQTMRLAASDVLDALAAKGLCVIEVASIPYDERPTDPHHGGKVSP